MKGGLTKVGTMRNFGEKIGDFNERWTSSLRSNYPTKKVSRWMEKWTKILMDEWINFGLSLQNWVKETFSYNNNNSPSHFLAITTYEVGAWGDDANFSKGFYRRLLLLKWPHFACISVSAVIIDPLNGQITFFSLYDQQNKI